MSEKNISEDLIYIYIYIMCQAALIVKDWLEQWCLLLVLEGHFPECFRCFTHLI